MYVARYTDNPEEDIKRGWSGWMGCNWATKEDAIDDLIEMPDDDELEAKQQRWIRTWGELYEDYDRFIADLRDSLADDFDIRFDEYHNEWRHCHHDGLSCWALDAGTADAAVAEAKSKDADGKIIWAFEGDKTHGEVKLVGHVSVDLYIFECDYTTGE